MQTIELTLSRPHDEQRRIKRDAARFNVVPCGRRFGKTTLGIDLGVEVALEGHPVGWFSPTYKDMLEVWKQLKHILAPVISRSSIQERRIELITGGLVEFWSLDDTDAGRGRKYKRVIIDEAGLVSKLLDAWQMAIRPTLADLEGDAFIFGTPKGRNGFWALYQLGLDPNRSDWSAFQMPSSANPHIPLSEIEAMRESLPQRVYEQEILAVFIDDAGGVFRNVTGCIGEPRLDENEGVVFGVDWGKHNDFTVITVITIGGHVIEIDRFNQIDYTVQVGRLKALADRYQPVTIYAESNSMGEPLIEQLVNMALPVQPFQTTNASKKQAIEALSLAFERGEITIPNDPILIGELQAFEGKRLPSGLIRYEAPDGLHDDMVMSLAIGWQGIGNAWAVW